MEIIDVLFYTIVTAIAMYLSCDSGGGKRGRLLAGSPV
jgi:hypothetical protein